MESRGGGDLVCKEDQKNENEIGRNELERKMLGIEEKQRPKKTYNWSHWRKKTI